MPITARRIRINQYLSSARFSLNNVKTHHAELVNRMQFDVQYHPRHSMASRKFTITHPVILGKEKGSTPYNSHHHRHHNFTFVNASKLLPTVNKLLYRWGHLWHVLPAILLMPIMIACDEKQLTKGQTHCHWWNNAYSGSIIGGITLIPPTRCPE